MVEIAFLTIPARPVFVGVARTVVVAAASTVSGIGDERLDDLRIAVSEACTNAVEAHQQVATEEQVVLRCLLGDDRLEVQIEDSGPGFNPAAVPDRGEARRTDDLMQERGWGLHLIRSLVDEAIFQSEEAGTAVHLVVRRGAG